MLRREYPLHGLRTPASAGGFHGLDLFHNPVFGRILSHIQFVIHLKSQPKLWGHFEEPAESQCRIRGDATFPQDNLVYPPGGNVESQRKSILAHLKRLKEFVLQNLTSYNGIIYNNTIVITPQGIPPPPCRYIDE